MTFSGVPGLPCAVWIALCMRRPPLVSHDPDSSVMTIGVLTMPMPSCRCSIGPSVWCFPPCAKHRFAWWSRGNGTRRWPQSPSGRSGTPHALAGSMPRKANTRHRGRASRRLVSCNGSGCAPPASTCLSLRGRDSIAVSAWACKAFDRSPSVCQWLQGSLRGSFVESQTSHSAFRSCPPGTSVRCHQPSQSQPPSGSKASRASCPSLPVFPMACQLTENEMCRPSPQVAGGSSVS